MVVSPCDAIVGAAGRVRGTEVFQTKGTSETHPTLSPNDEFAGFELFPNMINVGMPSRITHGYIRQALTRRDPQAMHGVAPTMRDSIQRLVLSALQATAEPALEGKERRTPRPLWGANWHHPTILSGYSSAASSPIISASSGAPISSSKEVRARL